MSKLPDLIAYAAKLSIELPCVSGSDLWEKIIKQYFESIGVGCEKAGVQAIGHIKGFLSFSSKADYCYFSLTSNKLGVNCEGKIDDGYKEANFDFNVIVYGGTLKAVEELISSGKALLEQQYGAVCTLSKAAKS